MSLILLGLMTLMVLFAVTDKSVAAFLVVAFLGVGFVLAMRKEPMFSNTWKYAPGFVLIFLGGAASLMTWPSLSNLLSLAGLVWMTLAYLSLDFWLIRRIRQLWGKLVSVR